MRPVLYFSYRYVIQLGFLDGKHGFGYHFMQGFWYRTLVDLKCFEIERNWAKLPTEELKLKALENITGYKLEITQ